MAGLIVFAIWTFIISGIMLIGAYNRQRRFEWAVKACAEKYLIERFRR